MSRTAWAKLPSNWAKVKNSTIVKDDPDIGEEDDDEYLPAVDETMHHPDGGLLPGLSFLRWREHKGGATAAIMVLFALAILSNLAQRKNGLRADNRVLATYDELQVMTELSRALIAKGLKLLKSLGAITAARVGNGCSYELIGIESTGKWCALPQGHLFEGADYLKRLKGIRESLKRPSSLHAMKLYVLLLAFRENHSNVSRISYPIIRQYTGMRRAEISIAVQVLVSAQLCRLAADDEVPLKKGQRKHNRYLLNGLSGS